jgi:hypothetical protein
MSWCSWRKIDLWPIHSLQIIRHMVKRVFDRKAKGKQFQVGDMVLLWDKKNEKSGVHDKFDSLWLGPYIIDSSIGPNTFQLVDLEGELIGLPVNGQRLKFFFQ